MKFISIQNIFFSYMSEDEGQPIVNAVDGVSLEIEKGEFVALLGHNGCGKSTVAKHLNAMLVPDKGKVFVDGDDTADEEKTLDIRKKVGLVLQNPDNQLVASVVEEDVAFGPENLGVEPSEIRRRVDDALKAVDMYDFRKDAPYKLSGGQKQRVAIGSAIMRRPKAFLMDEPLSNLDAKLRAQMRVELAKLHKELKTTVIYVTHDQTEAMTLGTKIIVMKDGVVQQVDTPQNLYEKPCNLFVAGFMGSPQMNFLDATVKVEGDIANLVIAGHSIPLPPAKSKKLIDGGYDGKVVTFGIRPEDVYDSEMYIETSPQSVFTSTIKVYELLGAEVYLYFDLDEFPMTARVDSRTTARPGDTVKFALDVEKIHVFDKETEQVITN